MDTTSRKMIFGRYDYAAFSTFGSYASCSLVIPVVLVALAQDLNFPLDKGGMSAGGMLHMARSIAMSGSMALCGFAAARWGNRRTLGLSVLLMGAGILLCSVTPWYGLLLVALLVAGVGEGVIEGLATPFVQQLHPKESGRYVNFTHGFWSLGVLSSVLLAGALLHWGVSWRIVVGATGALALLPLLLLLLPERKKHYPERVEKISSKQVCRHALACAQTPRFWLFFCAMFLAGGGEFCLTFWCASFIQLNFEQSALAGGVGTAAFAAGMFLGRTTFGFLIAQRYLRRLLLITGVAATLITSLIPILALNAPAGAGWVLPALFALLFLSGIATAPFWPTIQSYAVDRMADLDTTMVFILLSCAGVPGCGIFTGLMGWAGDQLGLAFSFYLVPGCFIIMTALIALDKLLDYHAEACVKEDCCAPLP